MEVFDEYKTQEQNKTASMRVVDFIVRTRHQTVVNVCTLIKNINVFVCSILFVFFVDMVIFAKAMTEEPIPIMIIFSIATLIDIALGLIINKFANETINESRMILKMLAIKE